MELVQDGNSILTPPLLRKHGTSARWETPPLPRKHGTSARWELYFDSHTKRQNNYFTCFTHTWLCNAGQHNYFTLHASHTHGYATQDNIITTLNASHTHGHATQDNIITTLHASHTHGYATQDNIITLLYMLHTHMAMQRRTT